MTLKDEIFPSAYRHRDKVKRDNHGKLWTVEERHKLKSLYDTDHTLQMMCEILQRPAEGILAKLSAMRLIRYDQLMNTYYRAATPTEVKPEIKEEIMSTKTIENITFIKGNKAETLTDNEIFSEIAKLEAQKAALNYIENKPKKLEAAIVKLQDDIQALVDYVDGR